MDKPAAHVKRQAAWMGLALLGVMLATVACGGEVVKSAVAKAVNGTAAAPASTFSAHVSTAAATSSGEAAEPFFCYVEILTGNRPSIYGYQAPKGCVPSAEFQRGDLIVWRFVVLDTTTRKKVTDKEAQNVKLRLADGTLLDAVYKQRGDGTVADAPWTWDVCWDIPLDYPIGALDYSIIVTTKDGRSGSWKPPALIDPVRGFDSRPRIMPRE